MPVVSKLNELLKMSLKDPEFQKRQADLGAVVVTDARTGREAHRRFMTQEMQRWKPVLAAAGETLD